LARATGIAKVRFVGRSDELQKLTAAFATADAGRASCVMVGGDAGVGKTRLLAEFATGLDASVLKGGCLPLGTTGLPFSPIVEVLRGLVAEGSMPDAAPTVLARLVPESPVASSTGPSSQAQLFQGFLGLLEVLATVRTVVLMLEDLHWADRSTRQLLGFVIHNLRAQRVLVVATYRSDDLHRRHPLRPLLAELYRDPRVRRIQLAPFSPLEVAEYLTAVTGSRPLPRTVTRVVDRTEGNAFFIEELVAADGLDGRRLPDSLRDLLLVRAEALSPAAQRLLRIASAAGRRFDDALLAAVGELPRPDVVELLREAVSRHLLVPDERSYRFRHALLREALQLDLLPGEQEAIHAAYASVLSQAPQLAALGDAAASAELAHHWQQAAEAANALRAWIDAGRAAERMFAFAEAHQHYERSLAVWDRVADAEARAGMSQIELLQRAAEAAFLGGDPDQATTLTRRAIALIDVAAQPVLAGVLHDRLAHFIWYTLDQTEALAIQRTAVELVPARPPSAERAHVLAGLGARLQGFCRCHEARRVSEEAVAMARAVGAGQPEYVALNTLGTITCTLEDVDKGLQLLDEAIGLAEAAGDAQEQVRGHWNLFANTETAGRWEDALVRFDAAAAALRRLGQSHLVPSLQVSAAECLFRLGRWDEAEQALEDARRHQPAGEDPVRLPELDVARGDFTLAREYLERQRPAVDREQEGWPRANLAELAAWEARHDDARALVEEGLGFTTGLDEALATAYLCATGLRAEADRADEAQVLRREGELKQAQQVGSKLLDCVRELIARTGPVDGWKREVGALAAQCEAEAARLHQEPEPEAWAAAVAAWERLSMPYLTAYCRWRQAAALLNSGGHRGHARQLLAAAHKTAVTLRAAPMRDGTERLARRARLPLGERNLVAEPGGPQLTPREHDVLELVAAGRSNRQIADLLYISEKTPACTCPTSSGSSRSPAAVRPQPWPTAAASLDRVVASRKHQLGSDRSAAAGGAPRQSGPRRCTVSCWTAAVLCGALPRDRRG
jgi:tetratricopeptide (TPR) repeat protein